MPRIPQKLKDVLGPILIGITGLLGFGLAAVAFLSSLQDSLAAG